MGLANKCEAAGQWWQEGQEVGGSACFVVVGVELGSFAFPGTGSFLRAFSPLGSELSTMVWVLNEGQGRDGILHPEPRGLAAAGC
jgi:hypothetical protein